MRFVRQAESRVFGKWRELLSVKRRLRYKAELIMGRSSKTRLEDAFVGWLENVQHAAGVRNKIERAHLFFIRGTFNLVKRLYLQWARSSLQAAQQRKNQLRKFAMVWQSSKLWLSVSKWKQLINSRKLVARFMQRGRLRQAAQTSQLQALVFQNWKGLQQTERRKHGIQSAMVSRRLAILLVRRCFCGWSALINSRQAKATSHFRGSSIQVLVGAFRQWQQVVAFAQDHLQMVRQNVLKIIETTTRKYFTIWIINTAIAQANPSKANIDLGGTERLLQLQARRFGRAKTVLLLGFLLWRQGQLTVAKLALKARLVALEAKLAAKPESAEEGVEIGKLRERIVTLLKELKENALKEKECISENDELRAANDQLAVELEEIMEYIHPETGSAPQPTDEQVAAAASGRKKVKKAVNLLQVLAATGSGGHLSMGQKTPSPSPVARSPSPTAVGRSLVFVAEEGEESRLEKLFALAVELEHPGIDAEGIATMRTMIANGRFPHSHYITMWTSRLMELGVEISTQDVARIGDSSPDRVAAWQARMKRVTSTDNSG
jgi:hypothetical protein